MAELTTFEVNEPTEGEKEPATEEKAPTEEQPDLPHFATEVSEEKESSETPQEDSKGLEIGEAKRPEGLPEKFGSVDDLVKAYGELEKKIGSPKESEEVPTENLTATNLDSASEEFRNSGALSESTYETLAKAGISKEIVNSYIEGQTALSVQRESEIKQEAQGKYEEMSKWATENLSQDELNAYNASVSGHDIAQAKFAVSGLYARFSSQTQAPSLTMGNTSGAGTMPFQDMQAVRTAMSDPRYKQGDKAYHAEVDRRLAVSNI